MKQILKPNGVQEIKRKSLHFLTIFYPIGYNLVSYNTAVIVSASLVIIDLIFETIRLLYPSVNKILLKIFEGTYREKEKENVSTLIWTLSGAFLTIFLFSENKNIVTLSLLYLALGDSVAAIVGVVLGRVKLGSRGKSLEGSLAFFLVAFICGLFFVRIEHAFIASLLAAAIEFLPLPIDDNFVLPIFTAGFLTILI
ncbi:MAG: SEC59/DGK1/VTE5 family protein [Endomicrobia bacterium]|nr:SEC59/DGK1/VTE5 family protein [Endomicrobiia bacterium]